MDIKIKAGKAGHSKTRLPAILGIDMAGVVMQTGAGVSSFKAGDEVYGMTGGTFLLGRKMYPLYSRYWQSVLHKPDSALNERRFAELADKSQHIVFTSRDFKPDWKNTRVAHDLPAEVTRLKKENGKNIIAWGGANFASSLIDLGLVDECR